MDAATGDGSARLNTWVLAKLAIAATGKGGMTRPSAPHKAQCEAAWPRLLLPLPVPLPLLSLPASKAAAPPWDTALTVQMPPSFPVLTSCASIDTGATSADRTARKLRNAAKRAHKDGRWRLDGRLGTPRL